MDAIGSGAACQKARHYREVFLYSAGAAQEMPALQIYTVSVDEKPGVQAIGLTVPDLPPVLDWLQ